MSCGGRVRSLEGEGEGEGDLEDPEISRTLRGLEESLLKSEVRKDSARVAAMLTEEFREFGASGRVYTKAEILAELQSEAPMEISFTEYACEVLTEGVALVTYRAVKKIGDREAGSLRSSVWTLRAGRWQLLFHQGTHAAVQGKVQVRL